MIETLDEVDLVMVTFTDPENLNPYQKRHGLASLPIVVDPDRSAYRAFGLGRGSIARVWGLRSAKRYLEIFRDQGFSRPGSPTEDTLQLGGDFIIDPSGTLIYGFWGDGPDDRPSAQAIRDIFATPDVSP